MNDAWRITAVSIQNQSKCWTERTTWLPKVCLPAGLRSFEMRGFSIAGRALADLLPALLLTCQLTSLVLQGYAVDEEAVTDDAGVAALAAHLSSLTALAHLGLPHVQIRGVGARALGRELQMSRRPRSLDLGGTEALRDSDAVARGIAACVGVTDLDLSGCWLTNSASVLCGMQARARLREAAARPRDRRAACCRRAEVVSRAGALVTDMLVHEQSV